METSRANKTHFNKGPQERESPVSFMSRDGGAHFQLGGGGAVRENSRRGVAGHWGAPPPPQKKKKLKSRGSEMVFSILSMRYFRKKNLRLDKV